MVACCLRPAAQNQQIMNGAGAFQPFGKFAIACEDGDSGGRPVSQIKVKGNVQPVRAGQPAKPVGPFHHQQGARAGLIPAQIKNFVFVFNAIEIRMDDGKARTLINLHQGEGGAGHFEVRLLCQPPDQRAGKAGFAGAQIT